LFAGGGSDEFRPGGGRAGFELEFPTVLEHAGGDQLRGLRLEPQRSVRAVGGGNSQLGELTGDSQGVFGGNSGIHGATGL
jgi:hypothetical protein